MDFVEICNVYTGKMIIKDAKRIFNSGKICRSYSDLNFGVTFLEHSVYVQYFIRRLFQNVLQLNILYRSEVKLSYAKITIYRSRASMHQRSLKQNTSLQVAHTSVQLIPHSGELCSKTYIIKRSETLIM